MNSTRFDLARVVIETTAPFAVGTGAGTDTDDATFVTDANGLPAIPGSSLAGALRSAWVARAASQDEGLTAAADLFGWAMDGDLGETRRRDPLRGEGAPSRVRVSWAQVHGQDDRPVAFLVKGEPWRGDPVLAHLVQGVRRDHVRIGVHGAVDARGKHDAVYVPTGARFTFELRVDSPRDGACVELCALLDLLASPAFHIGGRSRRGFGGIRVVRVAMHSFDLARPTDRTAWKRFYAGLDAETDALPKPYAPKGASGHAVYTLDLQAEDLWAFGGGEPRHERHVRGKGEHARGIEQVPVAERVIEWRSGRGAVSDARCYVPGSSVKGALRHRFAFHARRLAGAWAPTDGAEGAADVTREEVALFGDVALQGGARRAVAGRIWFEDAYLAADHAETALDHVSIDRFTGGPRAGMLFSESRLRGGGLTLRVVVDPEALEDARVREAFEATLDDLCAGRLALGASSNRGHGYFAGTWRQVGGGK